MYHRLTLQKNQMFVCISGQIIWNKIKTMVRIATTVCVRIATTKSFGITAKNGAKSYACLSRISRGGFKNKGQYPAYRIVCQWWFYVILTVVLFGGYLPFYTLNVPCASIKHMQCLFLNKATTKMRKLWEITALQARFPHNMPNSAVKII